MVLYLLFLKDYFLVSDGMHDILIYALMFHFLYLCNLLVHAPKYGDGKHKMNDGDYNLGMNLAFPLAVQGSVSNVFLDYLTHEMNHLAQTIVDKQLNHVAL